MCRGRFGTGVGVGEAVEDEEEDVGLKGMDLDVTVILDLLNADEGEEKWFKLRDRETHKSCGRRDAPDS